MSCYNDNNKNCSCQFNVGCFGVDNASAIKINGADRTQLNWSEISVPEILSVPDPKPDIEDLDQVFVSGKIICAKLIETPFAYDVFDIAPTPLQITDALAALQLAATISITEITTLIGNILAVPGINIPALAPFIAAINTALAAVTAAFAALTAAITAATDAITSGVCLTATLLVSLLQAVVDAVNILVTAINALLAAVTALLDELTANFPALALLVQPIYDLLVIAVQTVITLTTQVIAALEAVIIQFAAGTQILVLKENAEGTLLTGRKIVIDGVLKQKVCYTALVETQSVHSFCNEMPFTAYIIPYANFVGLTYVTDVPAIVDPTTCTIELVNGFILPAGSTIQVNICEEFDVKLAIEDVYANALDPRTVFKNVTVFLQATPITNFCSL